MCTKESINIYDYKANIWTSFRQVKLEVRYLKEVTPYFLKVTNNNNKADLLIWVRGKEQ